MTPDLVLIGCGKSKVEQRAAAKDLYTGSLFRARRRYAEASGAPWRIISALHHVLHPDEEVDPYDWTIRDVKRQRTVYGDAVGRWASRCWMMLSDDADLYGWHHIELHIGAGYAMPMLRSAPKAYIITTPLATLQIGEQLRWYREAMEG